MPLTGWALATGATSGLVTLDDSRQCPYKIESVMKVGLGPPAFLVTMCVHVGSSWGSRLPRPPDADRGTLGQVAFGGVGKE